MPRVFFFIKMCKKEKYADEFRSGILHANKVRYFRDTGIDSFEGTSSMPIIEDMDLTISAGGEKMTIPPKSISSVHIPFEGLLNLTVFCLTAIHTRKIDKVTKDNAAGIKKHMQIDPRCINDFGKHAVIVSKPQSFLDRVKASLEEQNYAGTMGLVSYFDTSNTPQAPPDSMDPVFFKRSQFQYQNEFRIAIIDNTERFDALRLCLGNLEDISIRCDSMDVNRFVQAEVENWPEPSK